jgi:glycosyltransferase involved in cell wall biosynthesis
MRSFDLILVDDGSPDRCGAICDAYAVSDNRCHVIHQKNQGLSSARNSGIDWALKNSASEWLFFVDSDDWIDERTLEVLYRAVTTRNVQIAAIPPQYVEAQGRRSDVTEALVMPPEDFWCRDWMTATAAWGKLYRKGLFSEKRFPEGRMYEDEFTTYKVLFAAGAVAIVDSPLYFYFMRPDSISHNVTASMIFDKLDAFLQQMRFFSRNGKPRAYAATAEHYISFLSRAVIRLRKKRGRTGCGASRGEMLRRLKTRFEVFSRRRCLGPLVPQTIRLRLQALYPWTYVLRWKWYKFRNRKVSCLAGAH